MPIFEKKGPFGLYLGVLMVHFSNSTQYVLKNSLLRGKFGAKLREILAGVFFLREIAKTSGHACVYHISILVPPPGVL